MPEHAAPSVATHTQQHIGQRSLNRLRRRWKRIDSSHAAACVECHRRLSTEIVDGPMRPIYYDGEYIAILVRQAISKHELGNYGGGVHRHMTATSDLTGSKTSFWHEFSGQAAAA